MVPTPLIDKLRQKLVTRPDEAWEFVMERGRRGVDDTLVAEVHEAFEALYPDGIVVNGALIPNVAKQFKALGFTIETLRHSTEGVIRATVQLEGRTFVLYQKEEQLLEVISQYIEQRLTKVRGIARAFYSRALTAFLKK